MDTTRIQTTELGRDSLSDRSKNLKDKTNPLGVSISRRSFLHQGMAVGAGAAAVGLSASRAEEDGGLTQGDAAILRFLAAAEILETDLWQQYNELGGVQDAEVPGGSGNPAYTEALKVLDEDMDIYIHDNTENE